MGRVTLLTVIFTINFSSVYAQCSNNDYSNTSEIYGHYIPVQLNNSHLVDTILTSAGYIFTNALYSNTLDVEDVHNYYVDSVFVGISHENNTGQADTIIILAYRSAAGVINENVILWGDTIITNVGLSANNNWSTEEAQYKIKIPASFFITESYGAAVCIKYLGNALDTFAIWGNSSSYGSIFSNFPFSCLKSNPDFTDWTLISDIWYPHPGESPDPYKVLGWDIGIHVCYDTVPNNIISNICYAVIDSAQQYKVGWYKGTDPNIYSYEILARKAIYNNGQIINVEDHYFEQPYTAVPEFTIPFTPFDDVWLFSLDSLGNTIYKSWAYYPLTVLPENISGHTQLKIGINWGDNPDFNKYYIFRGVTSNDITLYDSLNHISGQYDYYYDNEANSLAYYYLVTTKSKIPCLSYPEFVTSNIVCYNTLGLTEQALLNAVTLYPNPTQSILNINLSKAPTENINIQVLNPLGQVVKTASFDKTDNAKLTVDISALPTGVYFVKVTIGNAVKTLRLIKE